MKRYDKKTIQEVKSLRKKGYSIPQLMAKFDMPKTTIWHHVHDINLDSATKKKIRSRQGGSKIKSREEWKAAQLEAEKILSNTSKRELCVKGSMLYWAEGSKGAIEFTNTDPDMLRLYLKFLTEGVGVANECIKLLVRISDPIKPSSAIRYWSKELNLSRDVIKVDHNNKQNKTRKEFGICRIYLKKGGYYFKVLQCMISELKKPS